MTFKTLMVTGGSGFIGCNFIRYLLDEHQFDGRIVNVDALTYAANPASLQDIASRFGPDQYVFERVDICKQDALAEVAQRYEIDAICHFAAESHVDRSINSPGDFIQTNIVGTYNLLEVARSIKDRLVRFHHVSTDEVYGSLGATGLFTERTPYSPRSPYSASKAASDHLVRAYHETYELPITMSNCSNNYGPYQFPEKLIPLIILNAVEGKPLPVYGDGMNVRDWLYVRDHATAIWQVICNGRNGETYNVGGRSEKANIDVVTLLCDLIDNMTEPLPGGKNRRSLITHVEDRPGHDRRYAIDCTKITQELGWNPAESFESGMKQTVEWYLSHKKWCNDVRSGAYLEWINTNYAQR